MDPIIDRIEQQKQARHDLERDFGPPENGGSVQGCPECGHDDVSDRQGHIRPDGDERPPWLMVCEGCGHEWEEDE